MARTEQPTAPTLAAPVRGPVRRAHKAALGYVGGGTLNTLNAGMFDLLAMGGAAAVAYATGRDGNAQSRRKGGATGQSTSNSQYSL